MHKGKDLPNMALTVTHLQDADYLSLSIMILAVLLIVLLPELTNSYPNIRRLFTNNLNFMILLLITVCVIALDIPSGILVALFVVYGTFYYRQTGHSRMHNSGDWMPSPDPVPSSRDAGVTYGKYAMLPTGLRASDYVTKLEKIKDPMDTKLRLPHHKYMNIEGFGGGSGGGSASSNSAVPHNADIVHQYGVKYGPPLSSDEFISQKAINRIGTAWYPMS